jgi:hypothetical protein
MASTAKLSIRVGSSRGSSSISVSSSGRYASLNTNEVRQDLAQQPIQPTASEKVFWTSVLAAVQQIISQL